MVLEIATALAGLAMTEVVVAWSLFAGVRRLSQIVPRNGTEAVPYNAKNPPVPKNQGIFIIICSSQYAERKLATSREGPMV